MPARCTPSGWSFATTPDRAWSVYACGSKIDHCERRPACCTLPSAFVIVQVDWDFERLLVTFSVTSNALPPPVSVPSLATPALPFAPSWNESMQYSTTPGTVQSGPGPVPCQFELPLSFQSPIVCFQRYLIVSAGARRTCTSASCVWPAPRSTVAFTVTVCSCE